MEDNKNLKIAMYVILSAFIFSTMEVALKIGSASFDPLQLTGVRFFIGGLFLLPFSLKDLKKREVVLTKGDYGYMAFLGIFCIASMILFQLGVMNSNASTAAIIFSCNPMFTMTFAHFLTEEKFTKRKGVALSISLVGLLVIAQPWNMAPGNTPLGAASMLVSAIAFGLYTVLGKKKIAKIGGLSQTSIGFIIGGIVLMALTATVGRPVLSGIGLHNLLPLLYVGIVVTGLGYYLYFRALEEGSAAKASVVFFLKPMIAPVIALVVLHEVITVNTIFGVAILVVGSYVNMSGNKK